MEPIIKFFRIETAILRIVFFYAKLYTKTFFLLFFVLRKINHIKHPSMKKTSGSAFNPNSSHS